MLGKAKEIYKELNCYTIGMILLSANRDFFIIPSEHRKNPISQLLTGT